MKGVIPYNDVVNMQDVTDLTGIEYGDRWEVPIFSKPKPKPVANFKLRGSKLKEVGFLEKFLNPEFISEKDQWYPTTSPDIPLDKISIQDQEL